MSIKQTCHCDRCSTVLDKNSGLVFLGNVHVINSNSKDFVGGGLIGNNLDEDGTVARNSHYCKPCVAQILGIGSSTRNKTSGSNITPLL